MKARFDFDLNDCEEHATMMRMLKAENLCVTLWDLDQWLRNKVKHGDNESECAVYESCREHLHDLFEAHDVDLERLYQ